MKKAKKRVSVLTVLALLLLLAGLAPDSVKQSTDAIYVTSIEYDDLMVDDEAQDSSSSSGNQVTYTCSSVEEAGKMLRQGMKDRKTTVQITYKGTVTDKNTMSQEIRSIALEHTGVGDEGDYLNWNHTNISRKYNASTQTFKYIITYLDDAAKEKETTQAIKKLEAQIPIKDSDSTYEKVSAIYDYLAKYITFDEKLSDSLSYSTYGAVVKKTAVCQGYATTFYRILLDYGIDNRIIVSTTHAWNLVNVEGKYYECDLTWDSEGVHAGSSYQYFLKASLVKLGSHTWNMDQLRDEVTELPRASSDYFASKSEDAVPDLTVTKKSSTAVLKWTSVQNAQGYNVYRKTGSGTWKKIATVSKTTYSDKNLKKGTYSYRVQAYSKTLKGSYSSTKKIAA